MRITKKMQAQYTQDLFAQVRTALMDKGMVVNEIKDMPGLPATRIGSMVTLYFNEEKLCTYSDLRIEDKKPVFDFICH